FGGLEAGANAVIKAWSRWREAREAVDKHRARGEEARREAEWLRHAVEGLARLKPEPGGEAALAERRAGVMQAEKVAEDLRGAHEVAAGNHSPVASLSAALRRLERRTGQAPALVEPVVKALDHALAALDDVRTHLEAALAQADHDPRDLERIEERLFALRAAGRKYNVAVDDLAALAQRYAADLPVLDAGADEPSRLDAAMREAEARYVQHAAALSAARQRTAQKLDGAVNGELRP